MALISIKDAQVVRVNRSGYGIQVKEADRQVSGKTVYGDRYTVWFKEAHGLSEGDTVSVSGFLGAKVSDWTDREGNERHTVELSVNSPRVEGFPAKGAAVVEAQGWAEVTDYNDESPF
jgi:single-stranded DNA-binding protein